VGAGFDNDIVIVDITLLASLGLTSILPEPIVIS